MNQYSLKNGHDHRVLLRSKLFNIYFILAIGIKSYLMFYEQANHIVQWSFHLITFLQKH